LKNLKYLILLLPLNFIIFSSCNSESKQADKILQAAENIVEQFPDSALYLLDSIRNPYELNRGLQAKYNLLLVESKYKEEKDISDDTLIFKAKKYFKESNDLNHAALATFYSGRVLEAQQKPDSAMNAFLNAESIAIEAEEPSVLGFIQYNIGDALYNKGLYDEAITKLRQAIKNQRTDKDGYKKEIMALNFIGVNYAMKNNMDSAMFYFNDALSKVTDSTEQARILQNIGTTLLELGKSSEAKVKLLEAQKFSMDTTQKAKINLNLAKAYVNSNSDSAIFYIAKAEEFAQKTDDKPLLENIYFYLYLINKKRGDYKISLEQHEKYTDCLSSIFIEKQKANYLDIQKKYDFEQMRLSNTQLMLDKQRIVILLLSVTMLLIIGAYVYYRKKKQNEKDIIFAKQEIFQLKKFINSEIPKETNEIDKKVREILLNQFGIIKRISTQENKIAIYEKAIKDEKNIEKRKEKEREKEKEETFLKKIYTFAFGNADGYEWKELGIALNLLYDGYADRLKAIHQLNEKDFKICCLSKAGLRNSEIAGILHTTEKAIDSRKLRIRIMLGIDKNTNFIKELDQFILRIKQNNPQTILNI